MSALVSLPPSPPLMPLSSPDSFSSRSSSPCSTSSGRKPPPLPTYTSFDISKLAQARPTTFSQPQPPPPRRSARPQHRTSHSMSRIAPPASKALDFAFEVSPTPAPASSRRVHRSTKSVGPASTFVSPAAADPDGTEEPLPIASPPRRPGAPRRSRTLSFSTTQQAFLPSRAHLSASVTSGTSTMTTAGIPFPTVDEGKAASSVALDRSSSVGSSASFPSRRPRPARASLSARSGSSLRVPGAPAERADLGAAEYLEAKVVILGSQGVGKTSLITRSTTGRFAAARTSTIGASLLAKKLVIDNTKVHLQLWDAAGQERFRTLAPLFYRGALAAVLVYDVTNDASLQDVKFWMAELRKNMPDELIIVVVGAKADLAGTCPTVPLVEAQRRVAVWRDELERGERGETASLASLTSPGKGAREVASRSSDSLWDEVHPGGRPRTYSSPTAMIPTITTTGPPPTPPQRAHGATMSQQWHGGARLSGSISPPSPRLAASLSRPTGNLASSATMPDLSGYTLGFRPGFEQQQQQQYHHSMARTASSDSSQSQASNATGSSHASSPPSQQQQQQPMSPRPPPTRSSSSFGLMSFFPGSGSSAASNPAPSTNPSASSATSPALGSSTTVTTGPAIGAAAVSPTRRRSLEDRAGATSAGVGAHLLRENLSSHSAARRAAAAAEEARLDALVAACPIEVLEVSAKDGFGVEDVFRSIAEQLIEHKAEIERRQVKLRHKDSIVLREGDGDEPARASACAC